MQNTYRWGRETGSAHRLRAAAAAAAADDGAAVAGGRAGGRGRVGSGRRGRVQRVLGLGQAGVGHGEGLLAVQRHHHHICGRPSLGEFLLNK